MKNNTLDDYLDCGDYLGHPVAEDGFTKFFSEENGEYYFAYIEAGKVVFRSEGYTSERGRDNGIKSVKKNESIEKRYKLLDFGKGKYGLSLRAGNHQEIAITCPVDSEEAAWLLLPSKRAAYLASLTNNKNVDEYLECDAYQGHQRAETHPEFSNFTHDGEYYFALLDASGNVLLRSEGYTSESGRTNGMNSVQKNREIEKRYKVVEEDGNYYVVLKAGNHQEIGRSCSYESKATALAGIQAAMSASTNTSDRNVDEYLECSSYKGHDRTSTHPEFSNFTHDGEYYFALLDASDDVLLRSEGYTSESGRTNGMNSVQKNREIEKRYKVVEENGNYFVVLKAGNHQEIGRSCSYESEAAALAGIQAAMSASTDTSDRNVDEYLECSAYKGHDRTSTHPEFSNFTHDGEYYFALLDASGDVLLRSEGYTSESGRTNGMNSVQKNREIEKRYKVVEENGNYFVVLKAGNHQEIGRSCSYESEAAALAGIQATMSAIAQSNHELDDYLSCELYRGHERLESSPDFSTFNHEGEYYFAMLDKNDDVFFRSEGYASENGRDNGIISVIKNREIESRYKVIEDDEKYYLTLKAGNHQEIARSCAYDSEAAALAAMFFWKERKNNANLDEYLECESYKNHIRSDIHSDFSTFDKDGEHYFAMLDVDGGVILRSEGYTTIKARNNGIQSVVKNREIDGRYTVLQDGHHYYAILKAGNHQEIGRSCPYLDEAAALASMTAWIPRELSEAPKAKEDDYLKCDEYKGHQRSISYPEFSTFDKDGLHYFALLNDDDEVIYRSEGYTKIASRNKGMRSVLENKDKEERKSIVEKFGYYFVILKAGNHQEIARSCAMEDEKAALLLLAPLAAAAVPIVTIPDSEPESEPIEEEASLAPLAGSGAAVAAGAGALVTPPPPPPPPPLDPEPEVAAPVAAAGSGCLGGRWIWLLLGLLLLMALLYFFRGCFGCGGDAGIVPGGIEGDSTSTASIIPPVAPVAADTAEITVGNDANGIGAEEDTDPEPSTAPEPEPEDIAPETSSLQSIYYDYNKWDLRTTSMTELDKMVEILKANPEYKGEFLGHTDSRGTQKYNDRLSRKRAQEALNYVAGQGISRRRLSWKKFSENSPKAQNDLDNEQKLQLNRRVDLRLLKGNDVVEDTEEDVEEMR